MAYRAFTHWILIGLLLVGLLGVRVTDARAEGDVPDAKEIARLKAEMALRAEIPKAVERGVAWLFRQQQEDGSFRQGKSGSPGGMVWMGHDVGKTALVALTLAHCGVAADDPRLGKALDWLRAHWRGALKTGGRAGGGATYTLSLVAMTIQAVHHGRGTPPEGGTVGPNPCGLPVRDLTMVRAIGRWLLKTRIKRGLFGYPTPATKVSAKIRRRFPKVAFAEQARTDMSNTQYALLGLWACARCGVVLPKADLTSIAEGLLRAQARTGAAVKRSYDPAPGEEAGRHTYSITDRARGFSYLASPSPVRGTVFATGSMTAGGLSSLLIVKSILTEQQGLDERLARRLDHGIWDAIGWLTKNYRIEPGPVAIDVDGLPPEQAKQLAKVVAPVRGGMWHDYYLYGLERAMVIAGKRRLGAHDWYLEGARHLLDRQTKDGHWPKPAKPPKAGAKAEAKPTVPAVFVSRWPLVQTCFALLFLKRATLRPHTPLIEVHGKPAREDDR